MAENRKKNDRYAYLASQVINEMEELYAIRNYPVRIAYLESDKEKRDGKDRLVFGECEKVADRHKWAIDYDFTITLFRPNLDGRTEDQIKILLFHELLHIGIEPKENGGFSYSVVKHDLQDFYTIIKRYGVDWMKKGAGPLFEGLSITE